MPYQTPYNLYNPQQQYMNYFTQPMQQQLQQQQLPIQNQLSTGKIVDSIETVKVTDIPMDGNAYYFPKADGSEVYAKKWLPNGSTEVRIYKRYEEPEQKEEEPVKQFDFDLMESNLMDKLELINERISRLEKGLTAKPSARATKE